MHSDRKPARRKKRSVMDSRTPAIRLWWRGLLCGGLWLLCSLAHADKLLVLYPEIREPYLQVFLNILDGVRNANGVDDVNTLVLTQDDKTERLQAWLSRHPADGIISLGKRSLNLVTSVPGRPATVVGAVVMEPEGAPLPGISLVPDPVTVLKRIHTFLPRVRRVWAVYRPSVAQWLITRAGPAAAADNLTLLARPAADARQMALLYREILNKMNPETDALWIAVDGASPDRSVLQNILEESWRRRLWVFSGNLSDMKKGALFSFYPDNIAMGADLVALLKAVRNGKAGDSSVMPVSSLRTAVNLRTADHLNLNFGKEQRQEFNLMYPPPLDR